MQAGSCCNTDGRIVGRMNAIQKTWTEVTGLMQELLNHFLQPMFCRRLNYIIAKPFIFSLSFSISHTHTRARTHTHKIISSLLSFSFFFLFSLQKANSCRIPGVKMETDNTGL